MSLNQTVSMSESTKSVDPPRMLNCCGSRRSVDPAKLTGVTLITA